MKPSNIELKTLIFVLLFCVNTNLFSQVNSPVNTSDKWETWYDKVPVSGEIRVGIMAENNDVTLNPTIFYVLLPETEKKFLLCEISSIDGRYEATLAYNISNLKQGIHSFSIPTKYANDLSEYTSSQLTILTFLAENEEEVPDFYLSASWAKPKNYPQSVDIYLNSERVTTIVSIDKKTNQQSEFKCIAVQNPTTVAFNKVCNVPTSSITNYTDLFVKQRIRKMNKIKYNSYPINIKLPKNESW